MEQMYREFILELNKHPLNKGVLENATHASHIHNPLCGDKITMYLLVKKDTIEDVRFDGSGCAISQASASLLTEEIKGKKVEEVLKLNKDEILELIQIDLSKNPSRLKCALVGLEAVHKALLEGKGKKAEKTKDGIVCH